MGGIKLNEFWAALAGAVVGSLISGVISYVLQKSSFEEQRRDRLTQESDKRRALGHSLFFKVHSIANTLQHLKNHVDHCQRGAADEGGESAPPVTYLLPILNVGDPVQLVAEEMTLLLSTGADDAFNRVLEIAPIHNSILPVWQHYAAMRAELNEITSTGIDLSTGFGHSEFPANSPAAVKFFETNQVAQQLIERAVRDEADALEALRMLVMVLNGKAGTNIAIEPRPEQQPASRSDDRFG